ncbi:MAG: hypothetical protein ABIF40_05975 [archaeon]
MKTLSEELEQRIRKILLKGSSKDDLAYLRNFVDNDAAIIMLSLCNEIVLLKKALLEKKVISKKDLNIGNVKHKNGKWIVD